MKKIFLIHAQGGTHDKIQGKTKILKEIFSNL